MLSRRHGEAIVISGDITVTVLEVQGNRVKLGIAATGDTTIHRAEVYEKIIHCPPAAPMPRRLWVGPIRRNCRFPARREIESGLVI